MQILVVERTQQIQVEELENVRQQRHLDATVRKPAEAERFRLERLAEADRIRMIAEAEAEAEAIRLRGLAEAEAMQAVAKAEAEQMMKKAEAWNAYKVSGNIPSSFSHTKIINVIYSCFRNFYYYYKSLHALSNPVGIKAVSLRLSNQLCTSEFGVTILLDFPSLSVGVSHIFRKTSSVSYRLNSVVRNVNINLSAKQVFIVQSSLFCAYIISWISIPKNPCNKLPTTLC